MNQQVGGVRSFLPAVEGLRACAAIGVVITHVAFQTGHSSGISGRLWSRFDMAVAVFFALSGFLLWRGHAAAARGLRPAPATGHYLRSRVVRIMPAYLVSVVVILALLPDASGASLTVWLANLTLTQIYVPLTLTPGLTQMWSLAVEVSFYIVLPVLALSARRLPVRARVPVIIAVSLLSLCWGFLRIPTPYGINPLNWMPAYGCWFGAGMLLAEWAYSPVTRVHRLARRRLPMALLTLVAFLVAASPLAGPEGLTSATVGQFMVRTAMGGVLAWALLAPLVLDRPDTPHRFLASAPMVTLGRWSYGIFIWHLAALDMVFPVIGRFAFTGDMAVVLALTMVFTIAIAAVSYALVEQPCREKLRGWETRHTAKRADVPQAALPDGVYSATSLVNSAAP
ncbi:acyltransferase family protein [Mycolicibacter longobardus]|uniref:Acyltransferase n=1 Tax=Mycolicibacter longobardus TaxID=1108812 RepID=A0A1X1Y7Y9_9MYCO|nr:acyltransferase [Mycolicibacter longobardus]MCV7383204.1 acyltransferase [Mycolicibacter longobardus]ORW07185.1 acyltransferase [Mycolicibacter longobardus]